MYRRHRFLDSVVCMVDSVNFEDQLFNTEEASQCLRYTRGPKWRPIECPEWNSQDCRSMLKYQSNCKVFQSVQANVPQSMLLDTRSFDPSSIMDTLFLLQHADHENHIAHSGDHDHDHDHGHHHHHHHHPYHHGHSHHNHKHGQAKMMAVSLETPKGVFVDRTRLMAWLRELCLDSEAEIFRLKGIVFPPTRTRSTRRCYVLQGVMSDVSIHSMRGSGKQDAQENHRSQLVIIGKYLNREELEAGWMSTFLSEGQHS